MLWKQLMFCSTICCRLAWLLLIIKKDQSLLHFHFGNGGTGQITVKRLAISTYRGAWSIKCHEFCHWPIIYESSLIKQEWFDPSVLFEFSLEIQVRRIQTTKEIPQNWSSRRRKKALHFLFFSRHHHHQNCLLFFVF